MLRAVRLAPVEEEVGAPSRPALDPVHDPQLTQALRRLAAPPPPAPSPRPVARSAVDRAVYELD